MAKYLFMANIDDAYCLALAHTLEDAGKLAGIDRHIGLPTQQL